MQPPVSRYVLGVRVDATSYTDATNYVISWARNRESRYVCATSVHGVIESADKPAFRKVLNEADLITPDGMPLVWSLRLMGIPDATRVYGPSLTLGLCEAAERFGIPIGLYGGTPESLRDFSAFLLNRFPGLQIASAISPPFRPLTTEEDDEYTRQLAGSGAGIVFVGIGCPKQERWMAEHRDRIPAVLIGVGAAFDFHSGRISQAPPWMQQVGLEWLYRLSREPSRLWRRYVKIVPAFIGRFGMQYLRWRLLGAHSPVA